MYRARDTRLKRDVALKILPDAFAADPDRLARFQREAETLAALNHPHIAAIHGVEDSGGVRALVMEFVDGDTLAEVIARGPMPIDEALPIARQIAEALEAAHEAGIVHRDLKPANVKVRADGTVKVLDFGLAKGGGAGTASRAGGTLDSPTITSPAMTQAGMILGTAAYMSPEQAKGRAADKRSDVWAFGSVLYEMLTGTRAFDGEDVSETLAAVLRGEPDWTRLPPETPTAIRRLLGRALEKERKRRLSDMADARLEIEDALLQPASSEESTRMAARERRRRVWSERVAWAAFALALLAAIAWMRLRAPVEPEPVRVSLTVPSTLTLQGGGGDRLVAMSPDGRRIAFVTVTEGRTQIYLRDVDRFEPVAVAGTEGGVDPFFSPDGQWLGFVGGASPSQGVIGIVEGKLKKVAVTGGPPVTLVDAVNRGAVWGLDDTIVYTASVTGGLFRVSSAGGNPEALTKPEATERSHRWPSFLPGNKAVLFSVQPFGTTFDDALIAVRSLETGELRTVGAGGGSPVYVSTGHIVFARAGMLLGMPFDAERLEATGPPVPLLEGLAMNPGTGAGQFATAAGSLVYIRGSVGETQRELLWVDRGGVARPVGAEKRAYNDVAVSPDGRIAAAIATITSDIWVFEIGRGAMRRLTFSPFVDNSPVWTPDGRSVTYSGQRRRALEILQTAVDGSRGEEPLLAFGSVDARIRSWHPSGNWLAFESGGDIYVAATADGGKPAPLVATPFGEASAEFSPDGRWIAYTSDETGRLEVYLQAFPGPGGKWQVSINGGQRPKWSRNGRELFFRLGQRMMAASIEPGAVSAAGAPRVLFEGQYALSYDVAPDGRFLMLRDEQPSNWTELRLVLHWRPDRRPSNP
ncbi:MAG: protein kinase domain-containing protein [Acidobacteriota bacterium]